MESIIYVFLTFNVVFTGGTAASSLNALYEILESSECANHEYPQHLDGCFPVTGLKEIWLGDVKLLLQGQGPFVSITAVDSGKLLQKIKVFKRNNIHGFMIDDLRCQEQEKITALVWGGSSLRVIHIRRHKNAEDIQIGCETLEHAAPDWIYDICPAHIEDTHSLAYLITGHNSVLSINVKETPGFKYAKAIQLRHLFAGVKSTLYSANIVSLSPSHILIAAGTVFGEIIVWSCFRQDLEVDTETAHVCSSIHHFFTGHDGSIFGVSISDELRLTVEGKEQYGRLLASCSDDRTVRVWNISDCIRATSADKAAYLTDGFDLRSTGFGSTAPARLSSGSESSVAKGWGHASRIWGVYFLPVRADNPTAINLVSRGEDATCQLWRLDLTYNQSVRDLEFDLSHISVLNHHVGKHIWSLALSKDSPGTKLIYTGGNDGAVRKYELVYTDSVANDGETPSIRLSPYSPKNLVKAAHSKIHTDGQTPRLLAFVSRDSFVVVYASGLIQLGTFHTNNYQASQDTAAKPHIIWETLAAEEDLRSFASLSALSSHGLAVIGSANGILRLYNHSTKELTEITKLPSRPVKLVMLDAEIDSEKSYRSFKVLVGYPNSADAHLFDVRITGCGHDITQTTLALTPTFEISTGSLVCHGKCLAIGGKKGQLLLYSLNSTKGRLECSFSHLRAHGKEIVSFVDAINDAEKTGLGYVVTGGADGNYCLYRLIHQMNEKNTYILQRIHCSLTHLSQIERAYFDHKTGHFYLLGFRGARLTLWNESTQTETLTLDCGGAHRMWEFMANPDIAGTGTIIWIQARSLHALVADSIAQSPLQLGNHGREIKSLAVTKAAKSPHTDKVLPSLASGSEDTSIRISQLSARSENEDKMWNLVQSPCILRTHVTGLQQVKWSDDGRFLFSSAGREEFFAWHIRLLPEFGITALMEAACPREDYDSELRITSFDVLRVQSSPEEDKFLLALVYSNSTVKVSFVKMPFKNLSIIIHVANSDRYSHIRVQEVVKHMSFLEEAPTPQIV